MYKLIIPLLTVLLIIPQTTFADFSDVNTSTEYNTSIIWMNENGVIDGYTDGTFKPDNCVNRVEMLKMLYLTTRTELYYQEGTTGSHYYDSFFTDIDTNEWYWPYLNTALHSRVVEGYPDRTFKPTQCVKRVEAIKMAMEEFGIDREPLPGMGWSYADVDPTEWYIDYFYVSTRDNLHGRLHEYSDPTIDSIASRFFYPGQSMTRKEVAEMLYRMKTVNDNGRSNYSEDIVPNALEGNDEVVFDGCGAVSAYSEKAWYADYSFKLFQELPITRVDLKDLGASSTEGCLALDGSVFISVIYNGGYSQVFKYDTRKGLLLEASYINFPISDGKALVQVEEFLARNQFLIPMQGGCGDICGTGLQKATYNYNRNTLVYESTEQI
jgi:hypothetical protein